jgi:hypothetical protein
VSTVGRNLARILAANRKDGTEPGTALALGRKLGHTNGAYISHVLGGRKHPGPAMIARMAETLGVEPEDLTRLPGS